MNVIVRSPGTRSPNRDFGLRGTICPALISFYFSILDAGDLDYEGVFPEPMRGRFDSGRGEKREESIPSRFPVLGLDGRRPQVFGEFVGIGFRLAGFDVLAVGANFRLGGFANLWRQADFDDFWMDGAIFGQRQGENSIV